MLLFVSENPGSVVLESTHDVGGDKLNEGILWCPHLHQASGEAGTPDCIPSGSPALAVQTKRPSPGGGLWRSHSCKAITVTRQMLYGDETPLVGVGLVYMPHYITTEPFSALHGRLPGGVGGQANLIPTPFVNLSEMSSMLPVVVQHPILLDVATSEMLTKTDEPLAPLQFRGFRLHTVWTQQPGEDMAHQVAFPHFLGETTSPMLEYESEKVPQELTQGQKMVVNLKPPSHDHWNIVSDLILPLIQGTL